MIKRVSLQNKEPISKENSKGGDDEAMAYSVSTIVAPQPLNGSAVPFQTGRSSS
jgi:hypothetical protein